MTVTVETGSAGQWTAFFTLLLAIATFLAVLAAVFQDRIRSWVWRPKLELRIMPAPPDCHKTFWTLPDGTRAPCYYLRASIENVGRRAAERVGLFLSELLEKTSNGFERPQGFLPMNLVWAYFNEPFLDHLSPHIPKHCAIAHVSHPSARHALGEDNPSLGLGRDQTVLRLDVMWPPNTLGHLLRPGTYKLRLVVESTNAMPVTKWIEIVHTGKWFDDEQEMLSTGLQVRLLRDAELN